MPATSRLPEIRSQANDLHLTTYSPGTPNLLQISSAR